MKKINFYSGPAILPEEVIQQAQEALKDFAGTGIGILEISHRSKEFVKVMEEARALVRELMQLNADREVLFLQGGGSTQFALVPMNLLNEDETAAYMDTGQWAHNAMEEAKVFGNVHVACSSRETNYNFIPKELDLDIMTEDGRPKTDAEPSPVTGHRSSVNRQVKYLHLTTNNTVYGTQLRSDFFPPVTSKYSVVADMSSDIFSQQMDYNQFDLIYAAAQKNMGPAGTTLVVVNKNILGTVKRKIPKIFDYQAHIKKDSMYHTPSVFAVYVTYLTLQWIKKNGVKNLEETNNRKAKKLYDAIDASSLFKGSVAREDRSLMNVCFAATDKTLEEKFIDFAARQGITGIKGYRTVGGFRVSLYNAMSEAGVATIVEAMKEFERKG